MRGMTKRIEEKVQEVDQRTEGSWQRQVVR